MEIVRSTRPIFTYGKKHYFTLYGACYRKAKDVAVAKYFTPQSQWDDKDVYSKIKPEHHEHLITGGFSEPEHFDTRNWQRIKRQIARELYAEEKRTTPSPTKASLSSTEEQPCARK